MEQGKRFEWYWESEREWLKGVIVEVMDDGTALVILENEDWPPYGERSLTRLPYAELRVQRRFALAAIADASHLSEVERIAVQMISRWNGYVEVEDDSLKVTSRVLAISIGEMLDEVINGAGVVVTHRDDPELQAFYNTAGSPVSQAGNLLTFAYY